MQDVLGLPETTDSSTGNGTKIVTHSRLMEIVQNAYNMGLLERRDRQQAQPFPVGVEFGAALRDKQALQSQLLQLRADKQDAEAETRKYKTQVAEVTGERDHASPRRVRKSAHGKRIAPTSTASLTWRASPAARPAAKYRSRPTRLRN